MKNHKNSSIAKFFQQESAGGILIVSAAFLAIFLANSPFYSLYKMLIDTPVSIKIGALEIAKPLLLWVNDGLMAIFFSWLV
jgi:NhaA family Na+:H+ antiporter